MMKRRYQLSILQVLVATAVVALFTLKNSAITPTSPRSLANPFSYSVDLGPTPVFLETVQAGWPVPYWHAYGVVGEGKASLICQPEYHLWAMAADCLILVVITIVTATLTSLAMTFFRMKTNHPVEGQ